MDNERIIKVIKRVENYVIEKKMEAFKGFIINETLKEPEAIGAIDMASMYIKETISSSPSYAAERFKIAMLYMNNHDLNLIARIVGKYSKKGPEFLDSLKRTIEMDNTQAHKVHDFKRRVERVNRLIEMGYEEQTAEHFATSQTDMLIIDNNEKVPIFRMDKYYGDGITNNGEEIIYQELRNENNGKELFIIFFVHGRNYIRYIGEKGTNKVLVVNEKGTFEEIQEKEFKTVPIEYEKEVEELSKIAYQLPTSDPNYKELEIDQDFIIEVYNELNELMAFNGETFKAEDILNKKLKTYELK